MTDAPGGPIRSTIAGVELVTIPVSHYAELLDCQRRLAAVQISPLRFTADPRSRVERDPEVAAFLAECLGTRLLKDTYALCVERFGQDRTPGKSTIGRFWQRLGRR